MRIYMGIVILSCFAIILSCNNCEKLYLNSSEKQWVKMFNYNSIAYYKNDKGQTDTLIVKEIRNFHRDCNSIEVSQFQSEVYDVKFAFRTYNEYNESHQVIVLLILDKSLNEEIRPKIFLGNLGPYSNNIENKKMQPKPIDTILNGKQFNSIYYYAKDLNTENYGDKKYFENFFWDKEFGLIAYTTVNNGFFVIENNR